MNFKQLQLNFKNELVKNNIIGEYEPLLYIPLSENYGIEPKSKKGKLYKINSPYYKKFIISKFNKLITKQTKINQKKALKELKEEEERMKKEIEVLEQALLKTENEKALLDLEKIKLDEMRNKIRLGYKKIIVSNFENSNFGYSTHKYQLGDMQKIFKKNVIYVQTIKYFDNDNNEINDFYKYDPSEIKTGDEETDLYNEEREVEYFDFRTNIHEMRTINDDNILKIVLNNSIDGSSGDWKPQIINKIFENGHSEIITEVYKKVQYIQNFQQTEQIYKENENKTCVIDGCIKYFESLLGSSNRNAKAIYNKLIDKYDNYKEGIKDNEMSIFCNEFGFSINIINLLDGTKKRFGCEGFKRFSIDFINSKFNHLDLLMHGYETPQLVSKKSYKELKDMNDFYIEKYGSLMTIGATYKILETDYKIMVDEWKKKNNFNTLFIRDDAESYQLISTYNLNVHTFFNKEMKVNNKIYDELDVKKAYYNYSDKTFNKYYKGVPSGSLITFKCKSDFTIETFNKVSEKLIGFYQVKILSYISNKEHLILFGFDIDTVHTLTTSNIELLQKYIVFEFLNVSYGSSVHIPFTENFLNKFNIETGDLISKKDEKNNSIPQIRGYCKIFGCMLGSFESVIKIKPLTNDKKYFNLIQNENYEIYKNDATGIISIYDKTNINRRYSHITYTIHGYLMTILLEQMMTMNHNDIFGVKLDSIVIRKDSKYKYDKNIFDIKKANIESMIQDNHNEIQYKKLNVISAYYSPLKFPTYDVLDLKYMFTPNNEYIHSNVILLSGKGGSGKTYSTLSFLNNKEVCFTSLGWKLISTQKEQFKNIIGLSLQKILGKNNNTGEKCEKVNNNNIKYIVIDEATLINKKDIEDIIKLYPTCMIFILGDIDKDDYYYQCSINDNIIKPSEHKYMQCIEYIKTYRFDEELNNKLDKLRRFMKFNHRAIRANKEIFEYIKKEFSMCFKNKEDVIYLNNDIGISATDDFKNNNVMTNYFLNKGTNPKYFIKTTNLNNGQIRGLELSEKPTHLNYELKLFHTIHSFQGSQLTHDNKIIISVDKNFNYNLFYTAISRARRLNQVIILNN